MYAVDDLSDAIDVTRDFLTPITAGKWLRLLVVVFFIGGTGGGFTNFGTTPGSVGDGGGSGGGPPVVEEWIVLILVLLVVFGGLFLIWTFISSIMQFVFVKSLGESEVHVRRYAKENLGGAIHLFLFVVGLGLAALVLVGVPAAAIYLALGFDGAGLALLALLGLFALGLFLVYSVVSSLTINFVVPVMIQESVGIVGGWKRFWPTLRGEWKEYAVYYLLAWVLRMVVGMGVGFLTLIVGLVIGIPFIIVIVVLFLIPVVGWILAILLLFLAVVLAAVFGTLVQIPIETYFRYYALLVLGDTEERFDLIPDQRAAVRADGGDEPGDEWADSGWGADDGATDDGGSDVDDRDADDDTGTGGNDDANW